MADYPILEYDSNREAIINPDRLRGRVKDMPTRAVACFFQDVFTHLIERHNAKIIYKLRSEIGQHPIYQIEVNEQPLVVFHPGVGAPLAAAMLEEVIALGCTTFLACGGAGVLDGSIVVGHPIVVTSAVRDEGTSYHYLPPGREVAPAPAAIDALEYVLQAHDVAYLLGKTWTTDAIYRETAHKIQQRRNEGCLTVEMEAAAFCAVAQFRSVTFGQILYGGDDVSGAEHDWRGWDKQLSVREQLFWFAAEACLRL